MEKREVNFEFLKKIFIVFFAVLGFVTTIKLAMIYYDANFNPYALPSFCSVNNFIDCDGVAQTVHAQFLGIPLAYWGMFLYVFIIFLVFVEQLKEIKFLNFLEVFKNPMSYIASLGYISFVISISLLGVSLHEIKKICILCLFTYFLNLFIALVASNYKGVFLNDFKVSVIDFIDALRVKKYLTMFLILMAAGISFLAYTKLSYVFTPQVKRYEGIAPYAHMKTNPFKVNGNVLGDANAPLTVYIFTDYRCPVCKAYNVITHRAAQELGGFQIVHRNLPLDSECNKNIKIAFHEGACMLAKYSIAAEHQGRFWEMNSELFEQEPKNEDALLKMAKAMGFDTVKLRQDANSPDTLKQIEQDINKATDFNIDGTPTIVINGKVYSGIKPYYELKDLLIKAGAFERK